MTRAYFQKRYKERKEEYRARSEAWAKAHPIRMRRAVARHRVWMREMINSFRDQPCTDCKKKFPRHITEFDHCRGRKLFSVGGKTAYGVVGTLNEIAKCDLVCANCHLERAWKRQQVSK